MSGIAELSGIAHDASGHLDSLRSTVLGVAVTGWMLAGWWGRGKRYRYEEHRRWSADGNRKITPFGLSVVGSR